MKDYKFSIIVPVYNSERFLVKCLNSILTQTYKNLEIILINDGSKDGSLRIMQKFAEQDNRIVIIDQENAGVSAARNVGIARATGEFVIFVDSDDHLVNKRVIAKLYTASSKTNDVIMYNILYENKKYNYLLKQGLYSGKKKFNEFLFHMIKSEDINSPCNKVYRTSTLKKYKLHFNESIKIGEDLLFNIEYFKRCKAVYYLNDTFYFYRTSNTGSITSTYMEDKYTDLMTVNDRLASWVKASNDNRLMNIAKYIRLKNILSCLRDLSPVNRRFSNTEKRAKIIQYKSRNPVIIIRGCGIKLYVASVAYSFMSIRLLCTFIWRFYPQQTVTNSLQKGQI